jgi:hypothetical protein
MTCWPARLPRKVSRAAFRSSVFRSAHWQRFAVPMSIVPPGWPVWPTHWAPMICAFTRRDRVSVEADLHVRVFCPGLGVEGGSGNRIGRRNTWSLSPPCAIHEPLARSTL